MKKSTWLLVLALTVSVQAPAQKFFTRDALVQFESNAPMEKIQALNKSGTAVIDSQTGKMEWKVLIRNFVFEKALMQEHFNENYMESSKFPNATFKGALTNLSDVNFAKNGTYAVKVKGTIEIHGVKKEIEVPGSIAVNGESLKVGAAFKLACADFNIQIPSVVRDNIAKEIQVNIEAGLKPMK